MPNAESLTKGAIIDGPRSPAFGWKVGWMVGCRRVIRGSFKSRYRNCLHDLGPHQAEEEEEEHIKR